MLLGVNIEEDVRRGLRRLTPREEQIIRMRWGIGTDGVYSRKEIAAQWHITPSAVDYIIKRAIIKLRSNKCQPMRWDHWASTSDVRNIEHWSRELFRQSITKTIAWKLAHGGHDL